MAYPYTHEREVRVMSRGFGDPATRTLAGWKELGGYEALEQALGMSPDDVTEEVKASGLRGRGGAGFPTGVKWGFMPKEKKGPHYMLINADESEPGAFKDRELMRWTPHQVIEGAMIAAHAIRAQDVYIYIRGEFFEVAQIMGRAVEEAYAAGIAGKNAMGSGVDIDVTMHLGAGAYICGEETALMNSLEGRRGQPRIKPPFPAASGVFAQPTTINNVETVTSVPHIIKNGGAWYRQWGTEKSPGTKMFNVSGHVARRGNYELPLGFPMDELIYDVCGGIRDGRELKAVIPGGSSVPILTAEEVEGLASDYESVAEAGSLLGTASIIVMDDRTNMVTQVRRMVEFYAHESCGQCTPCREGTSWLVKILRRIEAGEGTADDIDTLRGVSRNVTGTTICVLSDSAAVPVMSWLEKFPEDVERLVPRRPQVPAGATAGLVEGQGE
ncbi:MAG: NADH-quinone oxidoreductase subunit NuoF [Longimicrobiales bacterium]|nr:NADH-quinone oxidoreductase subunit NuoF [Longimicrobiales bacterium]